MIKTPSLTEKSIATWQHLNATKNFDNTKIADRLRTVDVNGQVTLLSLMGKVVALRHIQRYFSYLGDGTYMC